MHGVGQEAASVPAAPCLAWHSIKQAVLGPVKSSSRQGSRLCGDAAGVPGHGRGEKPETLPGSLVIMRRKILILVSPLMLQQQCTFVQLFFLSSSIKHFYATHFVCLSFLNLNLNFFFSVKLCHKLPYCDRSTSCTNNESN